MDDLISRQAAIDALVKRAHLPWEYLKILNPLLEVLESLPSAQPVITCDGCRYVGTYDTDFPCCSCVRREKDYYEPE